jgi:hypothetical protein
MNSIKPFEHICFNNSDILFIFALGYLYIILVFARFLLPLDKYRYYKKRVQSRHKQHTLI